MAETIILWTRQVPEVWEEIQTTGLYRVKREYIQLKNGSMADYYLKLYEWYTKEARKYAKIPEDTRYPIWCSLDESFMLQPVENTIIVKAEVPKECCVLCNMDHWGYRVNYWYVPLDKEDERRHAEELKRYGIAAEDDLVLTSKGNFYPVLRNKITKSWERVFSVPEKDMKEAAGTVWELRQEWIREVRYCDGTAEK